MSRLFSGQPTGKLPQTFINFKLHQIIANQSPHYFETMVEGGQISQEIVFATIFTRGLLLCDLCCYTSYTGYKVEEHQRCDGEVDGATHCDYACLALV